MYENVVCIKISKKGSHSLLDRNNHEKDVNKRDFKKNYFTYIGLTKATYKTRCPPPKVPNPLHILKIGGRAIPNMMNINVHQLTKETKGKAIQKQTSCLLHH